MLTMRTDDREHRCRAFPLRPRLASVLPARRVDHAGIRRRPASGATTTRNCRSSVRPSPQHDSFAQPRAFGAATIDNVFGGFGGTATLTSSQRGIATTVAADSACRSLVVYAPRRARFRRARARHARNRRVQSRGRRGDEHRHARAAAARGVFLYDAHRRYVHCAMTRRCLAGAGIARAARQTRAA